MAKKPKAKVKSKVVEKKSPLKIFTDGSFRRPKYGAWGYCITRDETILAEASGGELDKTINQLELMAIRQALLAIGPDDEGTLYTDSNYSCMALTVWHKSWAKNNWVLPGNSFREGPQPVKNKDLLIETLEILKNRKVKLKWIRAHNTQNDTSFEAKINDRVDTAVQEITRAMVAADQPTEPNPTPTGSHHIPSLNVEKTSHIPFLGMRSIPVCDSAALTRVPTLS